MYTWTKNVVTVLAVLDCVLAHSPPLGWVIDGIGHGIIEKIVRLRQSSKDLSFFILLTKTKRQFMSNFIGERVESKHLYN